MPQSVPTEIWRSESEAINQEMERLILSSWPRSPEENQVRKMQFMALVERRAEAAHRFLADAAVRRRRKAIQPGPKPGPAPEPITEPGKRPMEDPPDSGPTVPTPPDTPSAKEPPTQPGTAPIEDPQIGPDTVGSATGSSEVMAHSWRPNSAAENAKGVSETPQELVSQALVPVSRTREPND
jgi:hypothetical protein